MKVRVLALLIGFGCFLLSGCQPDETPPTISLSEKSITLLSGEKTDFSALATATDEKDGDLTSKITISDNSVDFETPGDYSVIYQVTDEAGNAALATLQVTIEKIPLTAEENLAAEALCQLLYYFEQPTIGSPLEITVDSIQIVEASNAEAKQGIHPLHHVKINFTVFSGGVTKGADIAYFSFYNDGRPNTANKDNEILALPYMGVAGLSDLMALTEITDYANEIMFEYNTALDIDVVRMEEEARILMENGTPRDGILGEGMFEIR